jgi:nitroimidazol reductase NimA-like FMN-containing flavoprotein (pyridoxamine 5'-phosphate oxidase superfamily)
MFDGTRYNIERGRDAPMLIDELTDQECRSTLANASFGRLACSLDDQPYIVPVYFAYHDGNIYVLGTVGRKIEWMRRNPKVCLLVDEISSATRWTSVITLGRYQELREPQFTEERGRARKLLKQRPKWWQTALAERELKSEDELIEPIFFRIQVDSVTGLRSSDEKKSPRDEHAA